MQMSLSTHPITAQNSVEVPPPRSSCLYRLRRSTEKYWNSLLLSFQRAVHSAKRRAWSWSSSVCLRTNNSCSCFLSGAFRPKNLNWFLMYASIPCASPPPTGTADTHTCLKSSISCLTLGACSLARARDEASALPC